MTKTYLGYGISVERAGDDLILLREDPDDGGSDCIVLPPAVFAALLDWVAAQEPTP